MLGKHQLSLIMCLGKIGKVVLKLSKGEIQGIPHTCDWSYHPLRWVEVK